MDTTAAGLRRLADDDPAGTFAAATRQHANSIQTGDVLVSGSGVVPGGSVSATVEFPIPFAEPPTVVAVGASYASGGAWINVRGCFSITETGFVLHVQNANSSSNANFTNYRFQWIAVGEGTEVGG